MTLTRSYEPPTQHSWSQIEIEWPISLRGLKVWSSILGAYCAKNPSIGLMNGLGTLQAWISTHQPEYYSESSIGWILGAYTFFFVAAGAQFVGIGLKTPLKPRLISSRRNNWWLGPLHVILLGEIGIVLSLVCLSFNQGVTHSSLPAAAHDTIFITEVFVHNIRGSIFLLPVGLFRLIITKCTRFH